MLIAVPSKGRAGLTTTNKILPNLSTFFIPESEYHQYKGLVKNIVCVPKEVRGITDTRNWILENTDEKWVVFLDDDAKNVGYNKLEERKTKKIEIRDEGFWAEEFLKFFDLTEQLGYKIWGTRTESSPRGTYPYKPFLTRSYVTASCMGIVNDGEYLFDPDFKVKEDYEICLRHIKDKGGILAVRYLHWENEHWVTDGGCKDYRTIDMERDAIKRLIKLYPSMISSAKRKANEFTIKLNL
jgi:glycosyltransferase involved in cell wall biosynthesis